jgi:DNA primase catalytic core
MSPLIKDASLQAVLASADIVDVVSGYTSLRKRGATHLGLCPFHQEKTASFTVSADKGLYYCFGCGEGGDVVRFVQRVENLSFAEAVEQLGERFGVPVEFEEGGGGDPARKDKEARLLLVLEKAAAFYERFLWETESGRVAREYLEARGLREEVCKAFRVGLSPDEWRGIHRRAGKEGFTDREMRRRVCSSDSPARCTTGSAAASCFRSSIIGGECWGSVDGPSRTRRPSISTLPKGPCIKRAVSSLGCTRHDARSPTVTRSWWLRDTRMFLVWSRPGWPTWSRPWARRSPTRRLV